MVGLPGKLGSVIQAMFPAKTQVLVNPKRSTQFKRAPGFPGEGGSDGQTTSLHLTIPILT